MKRTVQKVKVSVICYSVNAKEEVIVDKEFYTSSSNIDKQIEELVHSFELPLVFIAIQNITREPEVYEMTLEDFVKFGKKVESVE